MALGVTEYRWHFPPHDYHSERTTLLCVGGVFDNELVGSVLVGGSQWLLMDPLAYVEAMEQAEGGFGGIWVEGMLVGEGNGREALLDNLLRAESAGGVEPQRCLLASMALCIRSFLKRLGGALGNLFLVSVRTFWHTYCCERKKSSCCPV